MSSGSSTGQAGSDLDEVDLALVAALAADARITNKDLAGRGGIAPSTCLARVRSLERAGVVRGYHADVDLRRLGREVEAVVHVRLEARARGRVDELLDALVALPEVVEASYLAGATDLLLRVAVRDTDALRRFVTDRLGRDPAVAATETSVVLRHVRSRAVVG